MDPLKMFVPITKIDEEQRLVYGVMAEEILDKSGEIFDYARSKPHFEAWSKAFEKVTDGKSKGNLRVMHGTKVAGHAVDVSFDDAAKKIYVCDKVTDDVEWEKCKAGDYTGFSIGGNYVERWQDDKNPAAKRYEAIPAEHSLVDNPCMYGATFTAVKAGGAEEMRKFVPRAITWTPGLVKSEIDAKRLDLGEIAGSHAAVAKGLNAGRLEVKDGVLAEKKVTQETVTTSKTTWEDEAGAAAKPKNETEKAAAATDKGAPPASLKKSLWCLREATCALETVQSLMGSFTTSSLYEGDTADAAFAERLKPIVVELAAIMAEVAQHEASELTRAAGQEGLQKMDAQEIVKAVNASLTETLTKQLSPITEQVTKVQDGLKAVEKTAADTTDRLAKMDERLKTVEATPAAAPGDAKPADKSLAPGSTTAPADKALAVANLRKAVDEAASHMTPHEQQQTRLALAAMVV